MPNKNIENRLKTAVDHGVPDVLEHILSGCEQIQPAIIHIDTAQNKKRKRSWLAAASAAVAAFIIVAGSIFGFLQYNNYHTVASVVSLDVNPCIEIKVNNADKVLDVIALNEDAMVILDGMNLKNTDIDVVINALIGSMVKNGYIDDLKNSILVSVENANESKGNDLQKRISDEINKLLGTQSIDGAILSQSVSGDAELRQLAEDNHISLGKAALIQAIIEKAPLLKFEDLAKLSINELNLLAESKKAELSNMTSVGSASDKAYIGEERARQIAFDHAKITAKDVSSVSVELDVEDGRMVYDVDFYCGGLKYEYEIDAVSGAVVKFEAERDSDDDHTKSNSNSDHDSHDNDNDDDSDDDD